MQNIERKVITILKILSEEKDPLGAGQISKRLKYHGIDLTERAVRYHLKIMDERGLTESRGTEGRLLTEKGREEVKNAFVTDKLGFAISKMDTLSYLADFNLKEKSGNVVLNVTFFEKKALKKALEIMKKVFAAKIGLCDFVILANEDESIGAIDIPKGIVGFATVCSITINSLFLQAGIPIDSRFGGLVQYESNKPLRFTDLITYSGTTVDPLEIFIASKMTSVLEIAKNGYGKALAGFRDIPAVATNKANALLDELEDAGFYGVIAYGRPGQKVLGMDVNPERIGLAVMGGLNPLAALEESGIKTKSKPMSAMIEFNKLVSFWDLQ